MKLGSLVMSVAASVEGTVFVDFQGMLGNSELELLAGEAHGFVEATGVRCVVANIQKVADVTTAEKRVSVLSRIAAESNLEKRPRVVIVGRCAGGCGPCEATYKPLAENAGLVVDCASTPSAARALVGL